MKGGVLGTVQKRCDCARVRAQGRRRIRAKKKGGSAEPKESPGSDTAVGYMHVCYILHHTELTEAIYTKTYHSSVIFFSYFSRWCNPFKSSHNLIITSNAIITALRGLWQGYTNNSSSKYNSV